jgi:hypothetical protein
VVALGADTIGRDWREIDGIIARGCGRGSARMSVEEASSDEQRHLEAHLRNRDFFRGVRYA